MKLTAPVNPEYAARVVVLETFVDLENCDNVKAAQVQGLQVIVGKDTMQGTVGLLFPAETQLSEEYASKNNLFRHSDRNSDPNQKGYLEDNRRVKAMKFRGHTSNALFMPLSSLDYIKPSLVLLPGDLFDKLDGHDICQKYYVKQPNASKPGQYLEKQPKRVDERVFPQHLDTANLFRVADSLPNDANVVITAKLHGTSIRVANTIVRRQLNWRERLAKRLGVKVKELEYDVVYGSRRTVKDPNNPSNNNFYATDIYSIEGAKVKDLLPKNYILFGELVGWTPDGAAIQKNYTYGLPAKTCKLYVYRVAVVNEDGQIVDLSWDAVKEFCTNRGLAHVPELWRGQFDWALQDLNNGVWTNRRFFDEGFVNCPSLEPGLVDEGVCVRFEGMLPRIVKAKSSQFLEHETKMLDKGVADMESDA